jgi:DNA-binding MarR family transcriptional regulator
MAEGTSSDTEAARAGGGGLRPDELGAWRGLLRVHDHLTRTLDAELTSAHQLPLPSYEVLLFLARAENGRLRMSELADSVLLSRSGLTRLVDRLEREGLVERKRCPEDARGLYATITDSGRRRFREARGTHLAGVRHHFLGQFSAEELVHLGRLWDRILPR